jgi:MOSC domain-containing protein YiiM
LDHFVFWQEHGLDPGVPAFGENLTVEGLTETEVHIGDVFEIGSVRAQVTSPRQPCYKIGARYEDERLPRLMQETGRVGYLLRVLDEGTITAGDTMLLVERAHGSVSLSEASRVVNVDRSDWSAVERLIEQPALAEAMRETLRERLAADDPGDDAPRLYGEGEGEPA